MVGIFALSSLTACGPANLDFIKEADAGNEDTSSATSISTTASRESLTALTDETQEFSAASIEKKKIDMLFVVDNSGSMSDEQASISQGFSQVASQYFLNPNLDICLKIITSDRYLGRVRNDGYQRERTVGCTSPDGLSASAQASHAQNLIDQFSQSVLVGTSGSNYEMSGKSLVTFLADQNSYSSNVEATASSHHSFFRAGAAKNISVVTDENNWFKASGDGSCNVSESQNDLPAVTGAAKPACVATAGVDSRKGLKQHIASYLQIVESSSDPLYSLNLFYKTYFGVNQTWSSMNFLGLKEQLGSRGVADVISASAANYAARYSTVMQELVNQASSFTLNHVVRGALSVELIHTSGAIETLVRDQDYQLVEGRQILLSEARRSALLAGDDLRVRYQY